MLEDAQMSGVNQNFLVAPFAMSAVEEIPAEQFVVKPEIHSVIQWSVPQRAQTVESLRHIFCTDRPPSK